MGATVVSKAAKPFLAGFQREMLKDFCLANNLPAFRAEQIAGWIYDKLVIDPEKMTNLPAALKEALVNDFYAPASVVAETAVSGDGLCKLRLELFDGESIETVIIPAGDRVTLCLSTQVGCPVGCRFCASGEFGLTRNLTAGEILEEFIITSGVAGRKPDNIVFMGIGEGLLNFDELSAALNILTHENYFGLSPRRITVSTSGYIPGMKRFTALGKEYNLAISLHAVNDKKRALLIPDHLRYPVSEILEAADEYRDTIGRQYTLEYTMVAGINDSLEDAGALAAIARQHRAKINLIPLNQTNGKFCRPAKNVIQDFEKKIASAGARVTRRVERGLKKGAACGQLRSAALSEKR